MTLPTYSEYSESGIEGLGKIPRHWSVARLGYEAWVRARLGWKGLKAEEYVDEGFVFLSTPNIKGREIDFVNVNFISKTRYDESPEIKLSQGDVLLAKDGSTLGTVNVVRTLPGPATVNSSIAVITPRERLRGVFLYYLFQGDYLQNSIQSLKEGMGVPHLFQEDLNRFRIPLPPLREQVCIAHFLDRETAKIDALISGQERLIALLDEKRQAIISHAVTRGVDPNAARIDSGLAWLGEVPSHWIPKTLKALFRQCKRQGFSDKHVLSVYRDYGVIRKDSRSDNFNKTPDDLSTYQLVEPGDLVVNKMKGWQGSLGISELEGITSPDYIVFTPLHAEDSSFIHLLLRSARMVSTYRSISNGIRPAQWRLEPDQFLSLKVYLPPRSEQEAIVSLCRDEMVRLEKLRGASERILALLTERRSALISAVVTGKVDVHDFQTSSRAGESVVAVCA